MTEPWPSVTLAELVISRPGNSRVIKGTLPTANPGHLYPAFSATGQDVFSEEYDHEGEGIVVSAVGARCGKAFLADGKWRAIANTHVLLPRADRILPRFLWYVVNDEDFWERGGTAQPFVKVKDSLEKRIRLPPIGEQHRLVGALDAASHLIALTTRSVQRLEQLIPALYAEAFGRTDEALRVWPHRRLMDLARPRQWPTITKAQLTESGFPVFGANGQIGFYSSYNHEEATVLISCRGTCGEINVTPERSYVTGNAMALDERDEDQVTLEYLEWALRRRGLADTITGSSQPQITRQNLEGVTLPIPPIEAQRAFSEHVQAIRDLGRAQQARLTLTRRLLKSVRFAALSDVL